MLSRSTLNEWLVARDHVILDGAMGTELERRGFKTELPLWSAMANIEAPRLVHQVHCDYLAAGADIVTANTFRTTRYTFANAGQPEMARHGARLAVELAREAVAQHKPDALVAASLAPLEDCYRPDLVPEQERIEEAYAHEIEVLSGTNCDLILVETMINLSEATTIAQILHTLDVPYLLSFTTDGTTNLLDGTPLTQAVEKTSALAPSALLINCRPPEAMLDALEVLQDAFDGPTGVYANGGGQPDPEIGWRHAPHSVEDYVAAAMQWHARGAQIIGGCCGTTPEMMRAVYDALSLAPGQPAGSDQ